MVQGLSPRVRGKPPRRAAMRPLRRSIPACAGEAAVPCPFAIVKWVYPRVCGGSGDCADTSGIGDGLSPRVRGKLRPPAPFLGGYRSIPACAGEALAGKVQQWAVEVYPRVCGGSGVGVVETSSSWGLSPRVRGKRYAGAVLPGAERSIPACAGEADWRSPSPSSGKVYPRVCGGSLGLAGWGRPLRGLSPRVRGKRRPISSTLPPHRSIPACAGEAAGVGLRVAVSRVYPRVCGGSFPPDFRHQMDIGLSPRVRGKLLLAYGDAQNGRSIPACAGEADIRPMTRRAFSVYPRVCGGSIGQSDIVDADAGLSPRVRGKRRGNRPSPA